jgi:hypothetical protein
MTSELRREGPLTSARKPPDINVPSTRSIWGREGNPETALKRRRTHAKKPEAFDTGDARRLRPYSLLRWR